MTHQSRPSMKHAHSFAADGHGAEDELGGGDGDRAAPFGDTFRSRGDYSSGTFYAYRRKFLADSDNVLKPPDEFMTKKQMRNSIKINRGGVQTLKTMVSYPTENLLVTKAQKAKQEAAVIRRNRKKNEGMIVLDTYSSVNEKDWSEEMHAGCRMWINHATGEVASVCPFEVPEGPRSGSKSAHQTTIMELTEEEEEEDVEKDAFEFVGDGIGHLVYDNSEFLELLSFLDSPKKAGKTPTAAAETSPATKSSSKAK